MCFQAWGQQLGCKIPLPSPITRLSRGKDHDSVSVSVIYTYQVSATLFHGFLLLSLSSLFAQSYGLSEISTFHANILFSTSKSHLTSVDSKILALNWMEKKATKWKYMDVLLHYTLA